MSQEPRVSEAERQHASQRLQAACVDGYLTLDEFSQRVEQAMAARTRPELSVLLADLPAASVAPVTRPARVRTSVVLSGVDRSGAWRVAEDTTILVVLGTCKLDLRRATISARVTSIAVRVLFGSLEMVVPSGVEVDVNASSFGSNKTIRLTGPATRPDAPRIEIHGYVLGGSLTVRDVVRAIFELA